LIDAHQGGLWLLITVPLFPDVKSQADFDERYSGWLLTRERLLKPFGLSLKSLTCMVLVNHQDYVHKNSSVRDFMLMARNAVIACPLKKSERSSFRNDQAERVFDLIERAEPSVFPPGTTKTMSFADGIYLRQYMTTDSYIHVRQDGSIILRRRNSPTISPAGSLKDYAQ
jgi:hypothetical protein